MPTYIWIDYDQSTVSFRCCFAAFRRGIHEASEDGLWYAGKWVTGSSRLIVSPDCYQSLRRAVWRCSTSIPESRQCCWHVRLNDSSRHLASLAKFSILARVVAGTDAVELATPKSAFQENSMHWQVLRHRNLKNCRSATWYA